MSQLFFKKQFQDAIRQGAKCATIRRWRHPQVRAGHRAFSPGLGWLHIEAVDMIKLNELSDRDAMEDGFPSAAKLRVALRSLYPARGGDGKQWFRVRFRLCPAPVAACGSQPLQT